MADDTHNQITGGIFFSAVILGRDITVSLPPRITPALSGLPAASAAFTGRGTDLDTLLGALPPRPIGVGPGESAVGTPPHSVVVTAVGGMGGVGKTELAVQAAHTALARGWFPGGVLFVDLFGYDPARRLEPGQALEGFLRALGIPGEHVPPEVQDRARLYASVLTAYAQENRRILVVVDNASTHEQAEPLLPTDGACAAIVTSRDTLAMLKVPLLDLDVLTPDEAVDMLDQALKVARPGDTRITGHPDDAQAIAHLCGRLPLALQIIAALLAEDPARPLAAMATDLRDEHTRLDELSYASVAVRATFDLSYQRLDPEHARLFRLLPVNPGPDLSTHTAAILTEVNPANARRALEALARAHLIERGSNYGRWRMHDLVRLYAGHHSRTRTEPDGRDEAFTRLMKHYLTATSAAVVHLNPIAADPAARGFPDHRQALAWLDTEYPNLTAAVYAAAASGNHAVIARDLPLFLAPYFDWRRHFNDWINLSTSAIDAARHLGDRVSEGQALRNLGNALHKVRKFNEAITVCQDAAEIFRDTGDQHSEGAALSSLGIALQEVRRFDDAIAAHQEDLQICREIGDRRGEGQALNNLGNALQQVRKFDDAIAAQQQDLQICREIGDRHGEGTALNNLGISLREVRRFGDAITAHQEAAKIYRDTGDRHSEGSALNNLGNALRKVQRFNDAITALQDAAQIFHDTGDHHSEGTALNNLGNALQQVRRFNEAITACQQAAEIYRDNADHHGEGQALGVLGNILRKVGRFDDAIAALQDAAQIFHDTGDHHGENLALATIEATQQAQCSTNRPPEPGW